MSARSRAVAAAIAIAAIGAGCKGKSQGAPGSAGSAGSGSAAASGSAAGPDWATRCEAALAAAPKQLSPVRRIQGILDGCQPCGDWAPLLRWATPAGEGGPTSAAIEAAMESCKAYCNDKAKVAFQGTLEDARGKAGRKPWRELGDACGAAVSAQPDARYMSAPYFALDRIARAAAAHPKLAPLLPAIELPLPAAASTGATFVLPAAPVTKPDVGAVHLSVSMNELFAGNLPRARLGAAGITVEGGTPPYPGVAIDPKALPGELAKLAPDPNAPIAIYAPSAMTARRLVDAVEAAGARKLVLAVEAAGAPESWHLAGFVPVALGAPPAPDALRLVVGDSPDEAIRQLAAAPAPKLAMPPTLVIEESATVASVAKLLGAVAYRDVPAVSLARAPGGGRGSASAGSGSASAGSGSASSSSRK